MNKGAKGKMKPSDLKTGMTVTTREGKKYVVALHKVIDGFEYDLLEGKDNSSLFVDDYKDDFTCDPNFPLSPEETSLFDIMKIESAGKVIWSRYN